MKTILKYVAAVLMLSGSFAAGHVHAQLIAPPPPPKLMDGSDGFTAADRKTLQAVYWNAKAIRAKLFPNVIDGTSVPMPD